MMLKEGVEGSPPPDRPTARLAVVVLPTEWIVVTRPGCAFAIFCVEKGANVNCNINGKGFTALMLAVKGGWANT